MRIRPILAIVMLLSALLAEAGDKAGAQLYRVSTIRAAPGAFEELLGWVSSRNGTAFFAARHSQGDQWDLLILAPLERMTLVDPLDAVDELLAFQEDLFAAGPPSTELREAYDASGLLHVEMFAALPGRKAALLEQRRMENAYLGATGQVRNMIFEVLAGADIDVFTIGFHEDLAAFAASGPEDPESAEAAARAAGFRDRADLSFYLRSLIASHHDTLATTLD